MGGAADRLAAAAGVPFGDSYPHPVVDHRVARIAAVEAYRLARTASGSV